MSNIETHINKLFRDIPDSSRKTEIMQEISQNLNEKVADLTAQGMTQEEAQQKAMEDIGDIEEIQEELVNTAQLAQSKNLGFLFSFSIWGSLLLTAFFVFINFYYAPNVIWFVYPLFAILWWPLSLFALWERQKTGRKMAFPYSVAGAGLIIALVLFMNLYYTPQTIWFVYPAFAVIWWPVSVYFYRLRQKNREDETHD